MESAYVYSHLDDGLLKLTSQGSDVHTITGGWGPLSADWIVPGHEIVGKVTHVGDEVKEFTVGQRVGVGAQVYGCLECDRCKSDNEQYCAEQVE